MSLCLADYIDFRVPDRESSAYANPLSVLLFVSALHTVKVLTTRASDDLSLSGYLLPKPAYCGREHRHRWSALMRTSDRPSGLYLRRCTSKVPWRGEEHDPVRVGVESGVGREDTLRLDISTKS